MKDEWTTPNGDPAHSLVSAALTTHDCDAPAWLLGEARALNGMSLRETVSEVTAIAGKLPRRAQRRVFQAVEAVVDGWFGGIDDETGYLDPLTGLPNSAYFAVRSSQLVARDGAQAWSTLAIAAAPPAASFVTVALRMRLAALTTSWFTGVDTVATARTGELLVLVRRHDRLVDEAVALERAARDLFAAGVEVTILAPRSRARELTS